MELTQQGTAKLPKNPNRRVWFPTEGEKLFKVKIYNPDPEEWTAFDNKDDTVEENCAQSSQQQQLRISGRSNIRTEECRRERWINTWSLMEVENRIILACSPGKDSSSRQTEEGRRRMRGCSVCHSSMCKNNQLREIDPKLLETCDGSRPKVIPLEQDIQGQMELEEENGNRSAEPPSDPFMDQENNIDLDGSRYNDANIKRIMDEIRQTLGASELTPHKREEILSRGFRDPKVVCAELISLLKSWLADDFVDNDDSSRDEQECTGSPTAQQTNSSICHNSEPEESMDGVYSNNGQPMDHEELTSPTSLAEPEEEHQMEEKGEEEREAEGGELEDGIEQDEEGRRIDEDEGEEEDEERMEEAEEDNQEMDEKGEEECDEIEEEEKEAEDILPPEILDEIFGEDKPRTEEEEEEEQEGKSSTVIMKNGPRMLKAPVEEKKDEEVSNVLRFVQSFRKSSIEQKQPIDPSQKVAIFQFMQPTNKEQVEMKKNEEGERQAGKRMQPPSPSPQKARNDSMKWVNSKESRRRKKLRKKAEMEERINRQYGPPTSSHSSIHPNPVQLQQSIEEIMGTSSSNVVTLSSSAMSIESAAMSTEVLEQPPPAPSCPIPPPPAAPPQHTRHFPVPPSPQNNATTPTPPFLPPNPPYSKNAPLKFPPLFQHGYDKQRCYFFDKSNNKPVTLQLLHPFVSDCFHLFTFGWCDFGTRCRFSHGHIEPTHGWFNALKAARMSSNELDPRNQLFPFPPYPVPPSTSIPCSTAVSARSRSRSPINDKNSQQRPRHSTRSPSANSRLSRRSRSPDHHRPRSPVRRRSRSRNRHR